MFFSIAFKQPHDVSSNEVSSTLRELADRIESNGIYESGKLTIYSELGNPIGKAEWSENA